MKLTLKLADEIEIKSIQHFSKKYLDENNDGIPNGEFLCPFGISAAVKRKQIIVLKIGVRIMGFIRFYPRKADDTVSVYQFALDEKIRGKNMIKKMLEKTGYKNFEINCFIYSNFNDYYKKTGWKIKKIDNKFNYWEFQI